MADGVVVGRSIGGRSGAARSAAEPSVLVGRDADCDVSLDDPSVSPRHARLAWVGDRLEIHDLDSDAGTYVRGRRRQSARARPGDAVLIGRVSLPWSHDAVRALIASGSAESRALGVRLEPRRFVCGVCYARGRIPAGEEHRRRIGCGRCGAVLRLVDPGAVSRAPSRATMVATVAVLAAATLAVLVAAPFAANDASATPTTLEPAPTSAEEASIRERVAARVGAAVDPAASSTRNLAVRIAAREQGTFRVEQVARIWSHVRAEWRYVADPRGGEYFARASETIDNELAGDCDDFATVLAAMIESVGGRARIVMVDGEEGGHAYAEACVDATPAEAADRLAAFYRAEQRDLADIHFRRDATCPVWLNLDWNASFPGGPYGRERWAVAIHPDGRTETLAPARPAAPIDEPRSEVRASAPPDVDTLGSER